MLLTNPYLFIPLLFLSLGPQPISGQRVNTQILEVRYDRSGECPTGTKRAGGKQNLGKGAQITCAYKDDDNELSGTGLLQHESQLNVRQCCYDDRDGQSAFLVTWLDGNSAYPAYYLDGSDCCDLPGEQGSAFLQPDCSFASSRLSIADTSELVKCCFVPDGEPANQFSVHFKDHTPLVRYDVNQAFDKTIDVPLIPTFTTPPIEVGEARIYNHRIEIDVNIPLVGKRTATVQPSTTYEDALCFDTKLSFVAGLRTCLQSRIDGGKLAARIHFTGSGLLGRLEEEIPVAKFENELAAGFIDGLRCGS